MKKETLLSRLERGGVLKKDGGYKRGVKSVLEDLAAGKKIYGRYSGSGRFASYMDTEPRLAISIAYALKLKSITGNDAPRGGKIGNFVTLAPGEAKKIKNILL